MSATSFRPRLTRLVILAVTAAAALSVAACGTSHKAQNENTGKPPAPPSPTRSAPPSAPIPTEGKDHVEGLIRSVSSNTIQLTQRNRTPATVDFSPSTKVIEVTPAQLTDVTTGSCVDVRPAPQAAPAGGAITAQSVVISPAVGGRCPPLTPPAAGSPGTSPAPSSVGPAESPGVSGTVAFVSGNTITVASTEAGGKTTQTNVTVTDATTYTKQAPATTQAITQGKCMDAQGTMESSGVLQATTISLEPCPPLGGHHHHFPHLPHHHHGG